jgi:hypothetical protein
MAEQDFLNLDFLKHLSKLGQLGGKVPGKAVGRKAMPKISITIDEEFRLPDEFGGQQLEDEEDFDFQQFSGRLLPLDPGESLKDMLRKGSPAKSKRKKRLEDEKNKKDED